MPFGFINRVSSAGQLRQSLDVSSARTRAIADRVSKATLQNGDGFSLAATTAENGAGSAQPGAGVDVEAEMVSLADEQLRYEATAKLLQSTYQKIRLSLRDR
jgi:flagellar basal body rod protein FlgB